MIGRETPALRAACALGESYESNADDRAAEDDRAWFVAHPTRRLRLRLRIAGEMPFEPTPARCVLVSRGLSTKVWQALASMPPAQLLALDEADCIRSREAGDLPMLDDEQVAQVIAACDTLPEDAPLRAWLGGGQ